MRAVDLRIHTYAPLYGTLTFVVTPFDHDWLVGGGFGDVTLDCGHTILTCIPGRLQGSRASA